MLRLWLALRSVAVSRLAEVDQLVAEFAVDKSGHAAVSRDQLMELIAEGQAFLPIVLLDVRPALEYQSGHLPGAISIPVDELPSRLDELPQDRRIIAYCRGAYCLFADEAVAMLRENGFEAERLDGGWPEWHAEGRP